MSERHPSEKQPRQPPPPGIQPWREIETIPHADCRVFTVRRKTCLRPDGQGARDFFFLDSADWVNVVALTRDHRIVLIRQYRFGIADFSIEIPGGLIDPGEDPVAAGLRELAEETGYVAETGKTIGQTRPNPAIQNNTCYFVLAENAVPSGNLTWDQDEEIESLLTTPDTAFEWARNGIINHALVLNALFHFEPLWQARLTAASESTRSGAGGSR